MQTIWTSVHDADGESAVLLVLAEPPDQRAAGVLGGRLKVLASISAALLNAPDLATVTHVVIEHIADAAGATVASLSVLIDEDTLGLVGLRGGRSGVADRYRTYPLAGTPAGDAVGRGRPSRRGTGGDAAALPHGRAGRAGRPVPGVPAADGGRTSARRRHAVLPRAARLLSVGAEFYGTDGRHLRPRARPGPHHRGAEDRASKLRFLGQATDELASSLDYEATLRTVAGLAVPWFADWCSIALAVDGELRTLEVAHVDPSKVALAAEYNRRYPPGVRRRHGAYEVLRTGTEPADRRDHRRASSTPSSPTRSNAG